MLLKKKKSLTKARATLVVSGFFETWHGVAQHACWFFAGAGPRADCHAAAFPFMVVAVLARMYVWVFVWV